MPAAPANQQTPGFRIRSLDQFRGYTVAGMFCVNFLGGYWKTWPALFTLQHHNNHFSYADSIMPQFLFAVGFAYRLTMLKRLDADGPWTASRQAIMRGLGLVLLSLVLFPPIKPFDHWQKLESAGWIKVVSEVVKGDLWETLAIIGVTSIWILPAIAGSVRTRVGFLLACVAVHVCIAQWFNFRSIAGKPNPLDELWPQVAGKTSFDGGPFGFLMWAMPMLVGSLAYDAVAAGPKRAVGKLFGWGVVLMLVGYILSCGTMLFTREADGQPVEKRRVAESPVIPSLANLQPKPLVEMLAEPPFFPPAEKPVRLDNYWTMSKRQTSLSFMLFATGFALAVYAVFALVSDVAGLSLPLFTTFGQNALAAYIVHELTLKALEPLVPKDSPLSWLRLSFAVFFALTWLFVRHLEKNRIFLKL